MLVIFPSTKETRLCKGGFFHLPLLYWRTLPPDFTTSSTAVLATMPNNWLSLSKCSRKMPSPSVKYTNFRFASYAIPVTAFTVGTNLTRLLLRFTSVRPWGTESKRPTFPLRISNGSSPVVKKTFFRLGNSCQACGKTGTSPCAAPKSALHNKHVKARRIFILIARSKVGEIMCNSACN